MPWFIALIQNGLDDLAEFNISAITAIAKALGLTCRFERQSAIEYFRRIREER